MQDVLASLSEQIVECTKFVEKFSYLSRLCKPTILSLFLVLTCLIGKRLDKDVLLETDATIQKYSESLDLLVAVLQDRTAQGTLTNVYHVLEDLDRLGEYM